MELNSISRNAKPATTPVKDNKIQSKKIHEISRSSENSNPNVTYASSPGKKSAGSSPLTKSAKSQKSAPRNANGAVFSPRNRIRERKFVVAKKNAKKAPIPTVDCRCGAKQDNGKVKKCLCVAYETLRASQEEFFKSRSEETEDKCDLDDAIAAEDGDMGEDGEVGKGDEVREGKNGNSVMKRRREKLLEEARRSVPESGKVMHLVQAFEKLSCIPFSKETEKKEENDKEEEIDSNIAVSSSSVNVKKPMMKWELPGMQAEKIPGSETQGISSCSSFCPADLVLTAENLGLDPQASVSSSWDGSRSSISSRTSNGGRRSRRNSLDSSTTTGSRIWKKKNLKMTSQKPFKLRTEQRGRVKEEEFMKKLQEMMTQEERMRIPVAQGLPWTTDEPECLIKPPVKEITRPVDLVLHSDIRAVERADFDQQVAEKMSLIEQYKMERERLQKLAEEEEIKRLRKELVPKAQPMPYFDRPFIPRRSMKHPTIPRDPKFHIPQHKKIKCYSSSWSDTSSCISEYQQH